MSKKVNHFEAARAISPIVDCDMFNLNPRITPSVLSAIETRKGRSFWVDFDNWQRAYDELCAYQWGLLMPCSEDLIKEIRSARGAIPENTNYGTEAYPPGLYPGIQLADVVGSLNTNGRSAALILASIETLLQNQEVSEDGQLEALARIVFLLGGV